jgi:hypothetical protein
MFATLVALLRHFRARSALLLGEFCATFGQVLEHFWAGFGTPLGKLWVTCKGMGQFWVSFGL